MDTISHKWADSSIEITNDAKTKTYYICKICSEPASNKVCKGCQMLDTLFKKN